MAERSEQMQILDMVENGVITAAEGARLLNAIDGLARADTPSELEMEEAAHDLFDAAQVAAADEEKAVGRSNDYAGSSQDVTQTAALEAQISRWRKFWVIPFWLGMGVALVGSLLMLAGYLIAGFGFWFGFAWLPLLFGLSISGLALASSRSRWMHLRIQQKPGESPATIAFSFPLPLRLLAWGLRLFGRFIPQLKRTSMDEIILAFAKTTNPETPLYMQVDEGDGERVEIYIG